MDHLSLVEVEVEGICHLMGRWVVEEEEVAVVEVGVCQYCLNV